MPHFLGQDYYSLAISERTAELNKAILAVPKSLPKHVNNCCINLLDILDSQSWKAEVLTDFSVAGLRGLSELNQQFQDLGDGTVESYNEDIIIGREDDEVFEVIPSSNPESSCSLDAVLGKEEHIYKSATGFCIEKFDTEKLCTENFQPFDEPLSINHFKLAIGALPSLITMLSQLKVVNLDDPVLKLDGSKWSEGDISCINYQCSYDTTVVEGERTLTHYKETFNMFFQKENVPEPFLPYDVHISEFETYREHIYNSDCSEALSNSAHDREGDFLLEDFAPDRCKLISGLNEVNVICDHHEVWTDVQNRTIMSFITLNNMGFSPEVQIVNNGGFQEPLFPFIEQRLVEVMPDRETSLRSMLLSPLKTLAPEHVLFSNCCFICKDFKQIEKGIWNQAKYFDETQIPEPVLPQETRPELIGEVCACLGIKPEEIFAEDEDLSWSFDEPDSESPMYDIATLDEDIPVQMQDISESFSKFDCTELEFALLTQRHENEEIKCTSDCSLATNLEDTDINMCNVDSDHGTIQQSMNPLDSFIQVRGKSESASHIGRSNYCSNQNKSLDIVEQGAVKSKTTSQAVTEQTANIRTLQVVFTGPWENVLQCILDYAGAYLEAVKQEALVPPQSDLLDITIDITRFLLKEREKQIKDAALQVNGSHNIASQKENIFQSLIIVHILRTAVELLLNTCLESCISYLAAQMEERNSQLGKALDDLHKHLVQFECRFLQEAITHPKLNILSHEVAVFAAQHPGCKILILVQKGLSSLISVMENMLHRIPHLTITVVRDWNLVDHERIRKTTVFVAQMIEGRAEDITCFNLVLLYDEKQASCLKSLCQEKGVSYVGLITQHMFENDKNDRPDFVGKISPVEKMLQVTVICSAEITQQRQLVCLLEAREAVRVLHGKSQVMSQVLASSLKSSLKLYNILIIERDYYRVCGPNITFADIIVSSTHCIVLLSLQEMKKQWDLSAAVKKFVAIGLQFSFCYIILHGMNAGTSYIIEKETLSNLYKLTAALCSLKGISPSFDVSYKIFVSVREENVASSIRSIVDSFLACNREFDLHRPWLSGDATQNEVMLLQMNCLNSFSAQLLLAKFTLEEILGKSEKELSTLVPEIPGRIFKYLHFITSDWRDQQTCFQVSLSKNDFNLTSKHEMMAPLASHFEKDDCLHGNKRATSESEFTTKNCQKLEQSPRYLMTEDAQNHYFRYPGTRTSGKPDGDWKGNFIEESTQARTSMSELGGGTNTLKEHQQCCSDCVKYSDNFFQHHIQSNETDDHQASLCDTNSQKFTPFRCTTNITDVCENSYPAGLDGANAGLQQVYYNPRQRQGTEVCANRRPDFAHLDYSTGHHSIHQESLTKDLDCPCSPVSPVFGDTQMDSQNLDHWHGKTLMFDSSPCLSLKSIRCDDEDMEHFCPKIARVVESCDTQTTDKSLRSNTTKHASYPYCFSEQFERYTPFVEHEREEKFMYETHKSDQSPDLSHGEILQGINNRDRRHSMRGRFLPFGTSNKSKKHTSYLHSEMSALYEPIKKDVDDECSDMNLNFTWDLNKSVSLRKSFQNSDCCSDNCDRLEQHEIYDCSENNSDTHFWNPKNAWPTSIGSAGVSSLWLNNEHFHDAVNYPSSADTTYHTGNGFGIFSSKARRYTDTDTILPVLDDVCRKGPSISTDVTAEHIRSLTNDVPGCTINWPSLELQSEEKLKLNLQSPPFSVSKGLRRHIKRQENTLYGHQFSASSFLESKQSSARVSRQLDFASRDTDTRNFDGLDHLFSTRKNEVKQIDHEFQHQMKETDSTKFGTADLISNPTCNKNAYKNVPEFGDRVQPASRMGSNSFDSGRISSFHETYDNNYSERNPFSHYSQSMAHSQHPSCCTTKSISSIGESVAAFSHHQSWQPSKSDGTVLSHFNRQSNMPYTPRHRVTVGLAQPFRRQNNTETNSDSTAQHRPSNVLSQPHRSIQLSESPPMDLAPDERSNTCKKDEELEYEKCIHEAKLKKWNQHFLCSKPQAEDLPLVDHLNSSACSKMVNQTVGGLPSNRKRKLQLERRAGNNGQSVLVFK